MNNDTVTIYDHLYRYRSLTTEYWVDDLESSISENKVWCNPLSEQNDPFEGNPFYSQDRPIAVREWLKKFYANSQNIGKIVTGATMPIPSKSDGNRRMIKEMLGPTLFAANHYLATVNLMLSLWSKKNSISCFCAESKSILMWSHYADAHGGICVEWERTGELINFNTIFLAPVIYAKERGEITTTDVLALLHWVGASCYELSDKNEHDYFEPGFETIKKLVLQKSADWFYEREWRLVSLSNNSSGYKVVPGYQVSRVLLGANISLEVRGHVEKVVDGRVPVVELAVSQREYGFVEK